MAFELPKLPYAKNALAPFLSEETLEYHYGKHHAAYVKKLNELIEKTKFANMPLEEIIKTADQGPIFNKAAQHWNHSFYWNCLTPLREPASLAGRWPPRSCETSKASRNSPSSSAKRRLRNSGAAGRGSCNGKMVRWQSRRRRMPTIHWFATSSRYWLATCGSTPTISTIAMPAPNM